MEVRPAMLNDAAPMARLMTELGYPTEEREMRERLVPILADHASVTLVAEREGTVVGMVGGRIGRYYGKSELYCRILALSVDPEAQGSGAGSQLVAAVEGWALERGARTMIVNTRNHRTEAHRFYAHRGYEATGIRFIKELPAAG